MEPNATMRGVVYQGVPFHVKVVDLPIPTIQKPTDAIVRITTAGICGTDLHTYHGLLGSAAPPWGMGHEAVGYITEVGDAVTSHHIGDYIVIPDSVASGHLDETEPPNLGFGGWGLGGLQGQHAYVIHSKVNHNTNANVH